MVAGIVGGFPGPAKGGEPVSKRRLGRTGEELSIIGFGLALLVMSSTSVLLWPSVRDTFQNYDLPEAVKAFLGSKLSIATGAGYLSSRYFS